MLVSETKQYASDSTRWYTKEGVCVNEVEGANGNIRKCTLREARKENLIPSVTSVLSIIAKPQLEKWKMAQVADACYMFSEGGRTKEEWIERVIEMANQNMDVARDNGTEIHGKIDRWLLDDCPTPQCAHTEAARKALDEMGVSREAFEVERSFSVKIEGVWVAGKCDLHYPSWKTIIDWKSTKSACGPKDVVGYDAHVIQLAAYSAALFGNLDSKCVNVFLSTSVEGAFKVVHWDSEELERGWEIYRAAYQLWTLSKNYRP